MLGSNICWCSLSPHLTIYKPFTCISVLRTGSNHYETMTKIYKQNISICMKERFGARSCCAPYVHQTFLWGAQNIDQKNFVVAIIVRKTSDKLIFSLILADCNWNRTCKHLVHNGCGFESSCSHLNFRFCTCFEFRQPYEYGFTLKRIHDMIKTYSQ